MEFFNANTINKEALQDDFTTTASSSLDYSRNKLILRAAKSRLGKRAYAQRQREKGMVIDQCNNMEEDPTDSNSIATVSDQVSVFHATLPELVCDQNLFRGRTQIRHPEDDSTSTATGSLYAELKDETDSTATTRVPPSATPPPLTCTASSTSSTYHLDHCDETHHSLGKNPKPINGRNSTTLTDWIAGTIGGNNNNGQIDNNAATPTEIESEYTSSAFPRVQAYKHAKNHQKKVPHNGHPSTSSVVSTDDEEPGTKFKIKKSTGPPSDKGSNSKIDDISFEPYLSKLERFEFFATLQAYYIVACDKQNTQYRVLRMDRTRMELSSNSSAGTNSAAKDASSAEAMSFYGTPSRARNSNASTTAAINNIASDRDNKTSTKTINVATSGASTTSSVAQGQAQNTLQRPLADFCHEDTHTYNQEEIQDMLDMIHHGNHSVGGLHPVTKAYGIVGIFRFLDCYYITLVTKRIKVGNIAGHSIYSIKQTETYPLKPSWTSSSQQGGGGISGAGDNTNDIISMTSAVGGGVARATRNNIVPTSLTNAQDPSSMLLSMWNRGKRSVGLGLSPREIAELRYQGLYQVIDLTKNFYFSYTYDMTRSLQENILIYQSRPSVPPHCKEMYCWNWYLSRELDEISSWPWMLPMIHGAYIQRQLHDYGRVLQLILLARRSRHFAGTRYLKRGVSDQGTVANDVEHEQMLQDEGNSGNIRNNSSSEHGVFSSYLQMRGSIPVYWSQESSVTIPKPPIVLNRVDPSYRATQTHFEHLFKRYGSPIVVLDLVKQSEKREREVIVGDEYRHAVDYLNSSITSPAHQIRYCALDYSHISKHRNLNISTSLNEVATWAVNQTGFFCSSPKFKIESNGAITYFNIESDATEAKIWSDTLGVPIFSMEQKGVLRTNCIDCLDRTNVAQFSAGVMALAQQLVVMGIRSSVKLDPSSSIVRVLIDMYVDIGDHLALQYGGSEAHKKGPTAGSSGGTLSDPTTGKHKELLTSIRRYYSNAFTDRLKQDAMNLFLGYYVPSCHSIPLWDIQDDFYLHNFHVRIGGLTMAAHRRVFGFDLNACIDDSEVESKEEMQVLKNQQAVELDKITDPLERVYRSFKAQEKLQSMWWRVAVQAYIQQRMWMQLVQKKTEISIPSRFDRIYQTEKLAQFDKLFSRSWAVPVRLSHAAQHSQPDAADICVSHYANFTHSQKKQHTSASGSNDENDSKLSTTNKSSDGIYTIKYFVTNHGLKPKHQPFLTHFLNYRHNLGAAAQDYAEKCDAWFQELELDNFQGVKFKCRQPHPKKDRKSKSSAPPITDEQIRYISDPSQNSSSGIEYFMSSTMRLEPDKLINHHRSVAVSEFADSLYETSLNSNDVDGILRLSKSAHICRVLESGPYKGLRQEESAAQLTNALFEKYDVFLQKLQDGESPSSSPLQSSSLDAPEYHHNSHKLEYDTVGVKETMTEACERFAKSSKAYSEMLSTSSLDFKRSDLTTESSLRLYCSMFDEQQASLSQADMSYILGEKNLSLHSEFQNTNSQSKFKVVSLMNYINSWLSDNGRIPSFANHPSYFPVSCHAKLGFEQINEDLYARSDNKFLVLNGPGVDSWNSQAVTKLGGLSKDFCFI